MIGDAQRGAERPRIPRVILQRTQCDSAELGNGIGGEQLRSAVYRVHRLPARTLAGMRPRKSENGKVRFTKRGLGFREQGIGGHSEISAVVDGARP